MWTNHILGSIYLPGDTHVTPSLAVVSTTSIRFLCIRKTKLAAHTWGPMRETSACCRSRGLTLPPTSLDVLLGRQPSPRGYHMSALAPDEAVSTIPGLREQSTFLPYPGEGLASSSSLCHCWITEGAGWPRASLCLQERGFLRHRAVALLEMTQVPASQRCPFRGCSKGRRSSMSSDHGAL